MPQESNEDRVEQDLVEIFDADLSADVKGDYDVALSSLGDPIRALAKVEEQYQEILADTEDRQPIIVALGVLLRQSDVEKHIIISEARNLVNNGHVLEYWSQRNDPKRQEKMKNIFERCLS